MKSSIFSFFAKGMLSGLFLWMGTQLQQALAQSGQTVTWAGGNTFADYNNPANWTPNAIPTNSASLIYTVVLPNSQSVTYNLDSDNAIDALNLGAEANLRLNAGGTLTSLGATIVNGIIDADGAGSGFLATAFNTVLSGNPRLYAANGAHVSIGASTYSWSAYAASTNLLLANGTGSLVELTNVTSFSMAAGSGARDYYIQAINNGTVDLASLSSLSGPASDDDLIINVKDGGTISLPKLSTVTGNVTFNTDQPLLELPEFTRGTTTYFNVGTNAAVNMPKAISLTSGAINVTDGGSFTSTNMQSLDTVSLSIHSNAQVNLPAINAFRSGNLVINPGYPLTFGLLTDIYNSSFQVLGGTNLTIGATSYDMADDYRRYHFDLLRANGTGTVINASSLSSVVARWAHYGSWYYDLEATDGGVLDLSGLENAYGAEQDEWLRFYVDTGGDIILDSLETVSRRTYFDVRVSPFDIPALQQASDTVFGLADGVRLELPSLVQFGPNTSIRWGFNSTFNAPNLGSVVNSSITLSPGSNWEVGTITNLRGASFFLSGNAQLTLGAERYTMDNNTSARTLFQSDGAGTTLNASSLTNFTTTYPGSYTIYALNNGVIDLSGLTSAKGVNPGYGQYLQFYAENGGEIRLPNLKYLTDYNRFIVRVPEFDVPSLEYTENTWFDIGDGSSLNMPALTNIASASSFTWGFNSTFNATNLTRLVDTYLLIAPDHTVNIGMLTDSYQSRIEVQGGIQYTSMVTQVANSTDQQRYHANFYHANGPGSRIDLPALTSANVNWSHNASWRYRLLASNGGHVNAPNMSDVNGVKAQDDYFEFLAQSAGTMRLGPLVVYNQAGISAIDADSEIVMQSLDLRNPSYINLDDFARMRFLGDFTFNLTSESLWDLEQGTVHFEAVAPQKLEIGGTDLGPTGSTTGNFGMSQMVIGTTNQPSTVILVDEVDNGNRGSGNTSEALYLFGNGSIGLQIRPGSRLVIGDLNVYAMINGTMQSLQGLIQSGENSFAFDNGVISTTSGARITVMDPDSLVLPTVDHVDVTFDIAIDASTLTAADIDVEGPGGAVAVTGVSLLSGNTYRIAIDPQSTHGLYTVRVGPNVGDLAGNLASMDQDGDGISGEPVDDVFVGTFQIDANPPVVETAASLTDSGKVGIRFDEPVDPTTATNVNFYLVNGQNPTNVVFREDGRTVQLLGLTMVGESFELQVNGVTDLRGLELQQGAPETWRILPYRSFDIGNPYTDPREPGNVFVCEDGNFDITGSGGDYYGTYDRGHFMYEARTGDFDVRTRVQFLQPVHRYTKAVIDVRSSLANNSPIVRAFVYPSGPVTYTSSGANGQDTYFAATRSTTGANMSSFHTNAPSVNYPNSWMRIRRSQDDFTMFWSTNGLDWEAYGHITQDLPDTVYVGLAASSVYNSAGVTATAEFREYGDFSPAIVSQPQSQSVASGSDVSFSVTARGIDPLHYQWFLNSNPLSGATNSMLILSNVTAGNVGDYTVTVTNIVGSVDSSIAILSVDGLGLGGAEADVYPRPFGNGSVSVADWVQIGRFVVGLDAIGNSSEFQRADCAPLATKGDGRLSVADWTQAGRYSLGLDSAPQVADGPTTPVASSSIPGPITAPVGVLSSSSLVTLGEVRAYGGSEVTVPVFLLASGQENAVGFSITFDPARMEFLGAASGPDAGAAYLTVNATAAAVGQVGMVSILPTGQNFPSENLHLIQLAFRLKDVSGPASIGFGTAPVASEVVSVTATPLPASYQPGTVQVVARPSMVVGPTFANPGTSLRIDALSGTIVVLEHSTDLIRWTPVSTNTVAGGSLLITPPVRDDGSGFYRIRTSNVPPTETVAE